MTAEDSVLITGATGQVGLALAGHFLAAGWTVYAAYRSAPPPPFPAGPGTLIPVRADLAGDGGPAALAEGLAAAGRFPSALVNAARDAAYLRTRPDGTVSRSDWLGEFTLDVVAAYELATALAMAPGSRLRSVVNVSSIYGMVAPKTFLYAEPGDAPPIHYGVAKAALLHLTRDMAARMAPSGIAVNAVSFGGVEGRADPGFLARYGGQAPAGRMLRPEDLGAPVEFLARRRDAMLTGQNLAADGGWTLW